MDMHHASRAPSKVTTLKQAKGCGQNPLHPGGLTHHCYAGACRHEEVQHEDVSPIHASICSVLNHLIEGRACNDRPIQALQRPELQVEASPTQAHGAAALAGDQV